MAILSSKAFQYPLTPSGKASLLDLPTEPTHRVAGDMMVIAYEADSGSVRALVPKPLELDGSGLVYLRTYNAWFYNEQMGEEHISPERIHYTETFFWIPCDLNGERYHYMPFSWVNRDWLATLGRHLGMPHKIATVQMTPFHPADPVYNGPQPDVRVSVRVDCIGTVLRADLTLKERIDDDEPLAFRPRENYIPKYLGRRFFFDVTTGKPLVDDLLAHWGDRQEYGPVWSGKASVKISDAENE